MRVIIKFKDGEHLNIPADCIDLRDGWFFAWNGEIIVAMARESEVNVCYISAKKEGER